MADDADLSAILRGLGPDAPVDASMPDDVWARIQGSLRAESAARAGTGTATDELASRRTARRMHSRRWAAGLVAASAVILAGVVVTSLTHSGDPTPLAASMAIGQPEAISGAGLLAPPAQRITHSQTDYSMVGLGDQVTNLMADAGIAPPGVAVPGVQLRGDSAPTGVAVSGVTSVLLGPVERLRECVAKVADAEMATALVVDLSTFNGEPAGIVVMQSPDRQKIIVDVVTVDCAPAIVAEIPTTAQPGMTPRLLP